MEHRVLSKFKYISNLQSSYPYVLDYLISCSHSKIIVTNYTQTCSFIPIYPLESSPLPLFFNLLLAVDGAFDIDKSISPNL